MWSPPRPSPPKTAREAVAKGYQYRRDSKVRRAAAGAFFALAMRAADAGPRGMGGARDLYAKNADGSRTVDPVSLDFVPRRRAVHVGKKQFDSATLKTLLGRDPYALNPLTRTYFPGSVYRRYSLRTGPAATPDIKSVMAAGVELARTFLYLPNKDRDVPTIQDVPDNVVDAIADKHGVFIVYEIRWRGGRQAFEATIIGRDRTVAGTVWHWYPYRYDKIEVEVRDSSGRLWRQKTFAPQRVRMSAATTLGKRRRM